MAVRSTDDNSLFFATGIDNSGLQAGINQSTGMVQGLANTVSKINPFGALAASALGAFAVIAKEAYVMAREFEQAMKEVETISAATQKNFKGIADQVFALSEISPDKPAELAKAYYQIVSAGYDGAKGLKLLEVATKGAVAGVTDTITAADGLTTVMNAFGYAADEAENVSDILFNTVKLGKTTFSELAASMSNVAPIASASGVGFEQVAAAVATLTKQGVPTSQAMTQIRAAIIATNAALGDGWSSTMSLQEAFKLLYSEANNSQTALKKTVGTDEAVAAILATVGKNAQGAAEDLASMGDAAGSSEKAFKSMANSNVNQFAILSNRLNAKTKELGNFFLSFGTSVAKSMNYALKETNKTTKEVVKQAAEYDSLKDTLLDSNTTFEERIEILKTLQSQYPEYLSSLDIDKLKNDNLESSLAGVRDRLEEISQLQSDKIILSGYTDDVDNAAQELDKLKDFLNGYEAEFGKLVKEAREYAAENGIELDVSLSQSKEEIVKNIQEAFTNEDSGFLEDVGFVFSKRNSLIQSLIAQQQFSDAAQKDVKNAELALNDANQALKEQNLLLFDNEAGYGEIANQIKQINSISELNEFGKGFSYAPILEAVEARKELLTAFSEIRNISPEEYKEGKLAVYLNSENEEIAAAALKRKEILTSTTVTTDVSDDELKARQKLKDKQLELERDLQQQQIDLMKEGSDKEIAQAKLNHQLRLDQINKEKADFEALQNKAKVKTDTSDFDQAAELSESILDKDLGDIEAAQAERIKAIRDELSLSTIQNYENELAAINKKYDELTKLAIKDKALQDEIEAARVRDTTNLDISYKLQALDDEKNLQLESVGYTRDAEIQKLNISIEYAKKRIALLAAMSGESVEKEVEMLENFIAIADKQSAILVNQKNLDDIRKYAAIITQIGETLAKYDNPFGDIGNAIGGVSAGLENLLVQFDESATGADKMASAISGVITLIDIVASSSEQRKEKEEAYYKSVIAYQKQYNLLLNDQMLAQASINENVFTTDFIGELQNGISSLSEAESELQNSLNALGDGKALTGSSKEIDWNAVGAGAAAGAATGAAIGSVVPIIGTAIGAAVGAVGGALVGLFGGKKAEDSWGALLEEFPQLIMEGADGTKVLNKELAQTLIDQGLVNDETKDLLKNSIAWTEQIEKAREQIKGVVDTLAGQLGDNLRDALVDAFKTGEDSARAMGQAVEDVLEGILEKIIFDQVFAASFAKLQKEMQDSFDIGGDNDWIDDFSRFFDESEKLTGAFNQALLDAQTAGSSFGLDLFGKDDTESNGLAGGISSITETTATVLAGTLNRISVDVQTGVDTAKQSLSVLSAIAHNTSYNLYLVEIKNRLVNIENKL